MATPQAILEELKKGRCHPVYLLYGDESYYIDTLVHYLEKNIVNESERGFNQAVLYGKDTTMQAVLLRARQFPMLAERQAVIVKEAQDLPDWTKSDAEKWLDSYLKNPLLSTLLVFAFKHKKPSKKTIDLFLKYKAICMESKKMYDDKIPHWVFQLVVSKGGSIDIQTATLLADLVGNDLQRLDNEVSKIFLHFPERNLVITSDIVYQLVGINREYNIFELQKALAVKDVLRVNRIVDYFGQNPKDNPAVVVVAFLFTYFTKLLLLHQLTDKSDKHAASVLKVHPFFVKEYIKASKHYPLRKVMDIIHCLKEADLQTKGVESNLKDGAILKELVFKIVH